MSEISFTNLQAELAEAPKFEHFCGIIGSMIAISTVMYALRKEAKNDESMSCIPYTKTPLVFFPISLIAGFVGYGLGRFIIPFAIIAIPFALPGLLLSYFLSKK